MDAQHLIKLAITASIFLLVFALGMRATFADATSLFRNLLRPPHRLLRALLAMYVVVPAIAIAIGLFFDVPTAVLGAMLAMAVAPVPPILPGKQLKFGGDEAHVFGLLVAVSLCSIVLVPLVVEVIGRVYHQDTAFTPAQVAKLIGTTVLLPLLAGLLLRHLAPQWAARLAPWTSRLGTVMLIAGALPVLIASWPALAAAVGGGALLAISALVACAIATGHLLGGPTADERSTLAIASAMRHPGVALAVASANVHEEPHVGAAVLLYVLVAVVLTTLYGKLHQRQG